MMRVGMGYDVHRLVEGRPLILGGVAIPFEKGLLGHSDADVLTHAVCDALLGAAALGDIGQHFPDTDPRYAGVSSLELLKRVREMVCRHYQIVHIDSVILAEKPRLAPHIPQMRQNLARALELSPERVSVKATTMEGLGEVGQGRAMIAQAVASLTLQERNASEFHEDLQHADEAKRGIHPA